MFRRGFLGIGVIRSDEGFSVSYRHKSVRYRDEDGEVEIGFEDDFLFTDSATRLKPLRKLEKPERVVILARIQKALEWDGKRARIFASQSLD